MIDFEVSTRKLVFSRAKRRAWPTSLERSASESVLADLRVLKVNSESSTRAWRKIIGKERTNRRGAKEEKESERARNPDSAYLLFNLCNISICWLNCEYTSIVSCPNCTVLFYIVIEVRFILNWDVICCLYAPPDEDHCSCLLSTLTHIVWNFIGNWNVFRLVNLRLIGWMWSSCICYTAIDSGHCAVVYNHTQSI